ncbi:hypothetical protein [Streptomyces sp. NPDC003393]
MRTNAHADTTEKRVASDRLGGVWPSNDGVVAAGVAVRTTKRPGGEILSGAFWRVAGGAPGRTRTCGQALTQPPAKGKESTAATKTANAVDKRSLLNPQQAAAILDWIRRRPRGGKRLHAFFATLYYCGLRSEEAFAMRVENVTLPEPDADDQLKPGDFALPGRVRWRPRRIRHPSGVAQRA